MKNKNLKGFTLIELLIVIGIIAILAGIVLVAVNPAQQFGKANDAERKSEIGTILSAIYQYQTSPTARGALPQCNIGGVASDIPACDDVGIGAFDNAIELGTDPLAFDCSVAIATGGLVPSYLREIPIDPSGLPDYTAANTGYWICRDAITNPLVPRIYILAPGTEVFTDDDQGVCQTPGTTTSTMCVSG